jgi:regulator of sigma E protease
LNQDEIISTPFSQRNLILVGINDQSPLVKTKIELEDKILQLKSDNIILAGNDLSSYSAVDFIQTHNNSPIEITYLNKNNQPEIINVTPKAGIVDGKKIIGAKFSDQAYKKFGFFESLNQAIDVTYYQLIFIFSSIWQLLTNVIFHNAKMEDSISGPIGLAVMTSKVATEGLDQILAFAAMLSLSLAVFNILPIPALDGGRILFVLIELVTRKKIKASYEQIFHGLGFLALLSLMVFVTYFDIVKAFN